MDINTLIAQLRQALHSGPDERNYARDILSSYWIDDRNTRHIHLFGRALQDAAIIWVWFAMQSYPQTHEPDERIVYTNQTIHDTRLNIHMERDTFQSVARLIYGSDPFRLTPQHPVWTTPPDHLDTLQYDPNRSIAKIFEELVESGEIKLPEPQD